MHDGCSCLEGGNQQCKGR